MATTISGTQSFTSYGHLNKSSSRVAQPPGGHSSNIFGWESEYKDTQKNVGVMEVKRGFPSPGQNKTHHIRRKNINDAFGWNTSEQSPFPPAQPRRKVHVQNQNISNNNMFASADGNRNQPHNFQSFIQKNEENVAKNNTLEPNSVIKDIEAENIFNLLAKTSISDYMDDIEDEEIWYGQNLGVEPKHSKKNNVSGIRKSSKQQRGNECKIGEETQKSKRMVKSASSSKKPDAKKKRDLRQSSSRSANSTKKSGNISSSSSSSSKTSGTTGRTQHHATKTNSSTSGSSVAKSRAHAASRSRLKAANISAEKEAMITKTNKRFRNKFTSKPSSRILAPPGGKSSISFY